MDQEIEQWSVKDGGRIELLAGNGGTDYSEDTGSDHRPDAKSGQRHWAKSFL
jgi:hypothetical protein